MTSAELLDLRERSRLAPALCADHGGKPVGRERAPLVVVWYEGAPAALVAVSPDGARAVIYPGHFGGADGPKEAREVRAEEIGLSAPGTRAVYAPE